MEAFGLARSGLKERFGIRILGTFDDDRLCVGAPSPGEWTSFFLADVPDLAAAVAFCDQFRSTPVGDGGELLWKYNTGAGVFSSPSAYMVNGEQFVTVGSGGGERGRRGGDLILSFALPR